MNTGAAPALAGVSRETHERLSHYEALLRKWSPRINLIARSTYDQIWSRHFLDSAQVYRLSDPRAGLWVDLGSGGGFPGLAAAVLAAGDGRETEFRLVESDARKAAFLSTAARELDLGHVRVLTARAEELPPQGADVVSARALAPLSTLAGLACRHLAPLGTALFPKGANHRAELGQALESWRFLYDVSQSVTDPDAAIYSITEITRA